MSNYDTETMPSLRRDIAESLTLLGVGYPSAILAADLREQRDERLELQDAHDRIETLEEDIDGLGDELKVAEAGRKKAEAEVARLRLDLDDCWSGAIPADA